MSDFDLPVFGYAVTFIGVAGAYVYFCESVPAGAEPPREVEARSVDPVEHELLEVA